MFEQYRVMDTSSGNGWYIHKISLYQRCIYHKPKLYLRGKCWSNWVTSWCHAMLDRNGGVNGFCTFLHMMNSGSFRCFHVVFISGFVIYTSFFSLKMYSWLKMLLRLNVGCWIGVGFFTIHRVVLICCWLGSTKKTHHSNVCCSRVALFQPWTYQVGTWYFRYVGSSSFKKLMANLYAWNPVVTLPRASAAPKRKAATAAGGEGSTRGNWTCQLSPHGWLVIWGM